MIKLSEFRQKPMENFDAAVEKKRSYCLRQNVA